MINNAYKRVHSDNPIEKPKMKQCEWCRKLFRPMDFDDAEHIMYCSEKCIKNSKTFYKQDNKSIDDRWDILDL